MSEKQEPFVINDRRKFRMDGELRATQPEQPSATVPESSPLAEAKPESDAKPEPKAEAKGPIPINSAHTVTPAPEPIAEAATESEDPSLPPPPTTEEMEQVRLAYETTSDRLDTMIRSQNLGGEHLPNMDFTQLVQSVYMSAMLQLGAGPQTEGQAPRVDILGAKQSIDMLSLIDVKTAGNLNDTEKRLIEAALFELRMGFLEITQMLARQAAARQGSTPPTGGAGGGFGGGGFTGGGPQIVR